MNITQSMHVLEVIRGALKDAREERRTGRKNGKFANKARLEEAVINLENDEKRAVQAFQNACNRKREQVKRERRRVQNERGLTYRMADVMRDAGIAC